MRVSRAGVAAGAAALALLFAVLVVAFRAPLFRASVAAVVDLATGARVAFGDLALQPDSAVARDVTVWLQGEPVLTVARLDARFRVRDLFPGGSRRYGLIGVDADAPRLSLIRRADGTFDLPHLSGGEPTAGGGGGPPAPATGSAAPWNLRLAIHRGSLALLDPNRALPASRHLEIDDVAVSATLEGAGRLRYAGGGLVGGDPAQRVSFAGRVGSDFATHRFRAGAVAVAPFANYFINAGAAEFEGGRLRDVDVRVYALGAPRGGGLGPYHVLGGATLAGGAMRIPGLLPGASGMRGRIDVFDGGIASPHLNARLGGIAVAVAGGIYDWSEPAFRLGLRAPEARLATLRGFFGFSRRLPLGGVAGLQSLLEGPVGKPLVATRFASDGLTYGAFPVRDAAGRAIYYAASLLVVGARGAYGGLETGVEGSIDLGREATSQLVVDVRGPARGLPYLAEIAPAAQVEAVGLLGGPGLQLDARGTVAGAGGDARLDATFHVDALGHGTVGPFMVRRPGSALAGAFYLDRAESRSGFWLQGNDVAFAQVAHPPRLPGIALAPPDFRGRLDGAFAGVGPPSAFRLAGHVHARDLRVGALPIDDASGDVAGAIGNVRLGRVTARGPWGRLAGSGAYAGGRLSLLGTYAGDFRELATITGDLGATGTVRGPVALSIDPARTLVQARGAATPGALVRGVPLAGVDGTLGVVRNRLQVYGATASLGGGSFAAAGSLAPGRRLGVSVGGVTAGRLRALLPLEGGGDVVAIGTIGYAGSRPQFQGGLTIGEGARLARLPLVANGDLSLENSRLDVRRADLLLGRALGTLAGGVTALGSKRARYDVGVHLTAAPLAPFAGVLARAGSGIAGTVTGDARVTGSAAFPALAGRLALPEGTVNGLAFRDAQAYVNVDPSGLKARRGYVTVGLTRVGFGALLRRDDTAIRLDAPAANLSDFNDYFDAGDTLGGRGRIAGRFRKQGQTVRTSADVKIASLHYRRFALGDATAAWNSRGPKVTGAVAFGGASGHLALAGSLLVPSRAPLARLLERSRFDGSASLRGLDLGVWLPALGYQLPLSGRVDAEATIGGRLRDPDVRTTATLVDGSIGTFPVDRFVLAATSTLHRTNVTRAELDLPSLAVTASGSFGLGERDRLALALHAKSANVGTLANRFAGTSLPFTGTGEVDLKVDGTRGKPHVAGGFDIEAASLRGVAIPRALGEFSARGRDVVLSDVEIGFATGTLYFAGSLPLQFAPFAVGPREAPVTLELAAKGVDLADFAPLLPAGSLLRGVVDGRVAVGGTAGDPRLRGNLALTGGAVRTVDETVPLTNLGAQLSFAGNEAKLERLHFEAGGGAFDASGGATFPSLVRPGADAAYRFDARAERLRLSLPAYGSGQVDGALRLTHEPNAHALARGTLVLSDATIPFSALLLASGGGAAGFASAAPPPAPPGRGTLAFDLDVTADRNVRVRSANVDIGGRGTLHVGGLYGAPALAGGFTSTGGTLAYFNTVFRLVDGTVAFDPNAGLIPTLNARAVTHVIDPDPNTVRNVAGSADVTLDVSGPVTNLTIALSSNPSYERQQILGLLLDAPALGASNLFGETSQGATLYGSTATSNLAPGAAGIRNSNGQFSVAQEAFGIANAQFTRTLLAPIESTFASAVGLSSFNVNVDYTGNVGLSARKVLGSKVNALYGTTFGYPYRQTFGFEFKPDAATAAQLTAFQTLGVNGLDSLTPTTYITATNQRLQAAQPTGGTAGVSLSLQRLFP